MSGHNYCYQCLVSCTALLSVVTSGMYYAWPSQSLPLLLGKNGTTIQISSGQGSWLAVISLFGCMLSCYPASVTVNIIGRKKLILLTAAPHFISWMFIAFAQSIDTLYCARFLSGLADGLIFNAVPMYLGEICDSSIRGFTGSFITVSWILGMFLVNLVGSFCTIRNTAIFCSMVPLSLAVTLPWMPESPYFLLMNNRMEEAKECLQKIKGCTTSDLYQPLAQIKYRTCLTTANPFRELFMKKGNRKALKIVLILRGSQQLTGVAAMIFYTKSIFAESTNAVNPTTGTLIYLFFQCFTASICSLIVDRTGRRPLLLVSLTGTALALLVKATYFYLKDFTSIDTSMFDYVPVIALMAYGIFFSLGIQPVPLLMMSELFSVNVKALASGFCQIYFCVLVVAVSKFFQEARDRCGDCLPFGIFGCISVLNVVLVAVFVPETKGQTLEEIQELLNDDVENVKLKTYGIRRNLG